MLTTEEKQELQLYFSGATVRFDETKNSAGKEEGIHSHKLESGRVAHYLYHYNTDSITVFDIVEPPDDTPIKKLTDFLNDNPDVKGLLGL